MPVTEFALLKLRSLDGTIPPAVAAELRSARDAMQRYSGHAFYYLQQVEDPAYVYVLGQWASLAQHYDGFIPSPANQAALAALRDELDIVWLSHLDVPLDAIQLDAPVLSVGRHVLAPEKRAAFEARFDEKKKYLAEFVTKGNLAAGWKLEEDRAAEEFVLFAPWENVDQHTAFAGEEGFKEYAKIREFVEEAEIKHVKVLEL